MIVNSLSLTDGYKPSHYKQYPKGVTELSAYLEARKNSKFENISFFGLQYYLKEYILPFVERMNIDEAEYNWTHYGLPFNREGWTKIEDLGYFPLEIQAVPEGSFIPKSNVLVQVRNTLPEFAWLVTWIETSLEQNWYPSTVATADKYGRTMVRKYLDDTGCENIDPVLSYMVHDFGYRGCSCLEQAMIGGAAHLSIGYKGTDTFPALDFICEYYHKKMAGSSIEAMEHSTVISWDNEDDAYQNMLDKSLKKDSIIACVGDSTDFDRVNNNWGKRFKEQIVNSGGRLVSRGDSGNPVQVSLDAIENLLNNFGYTTNSKGYKVLPNCIRFLWGDGVDYRDIDEILYRLQGANIAAENIAFGMGGGLLQRGLDRDTCSFAYKVNEKVENGIRKPLCKNPKNSKWKASKAGRLALVQGHGCYATIPEVEIGKRNNVLQTVFKDGDLLVDWSFDEIRERASFIPI